MFIHLAVHHPHPEKADLLVESMQRFAAAMQDQAGLQQAFTLRDERTGTLVGLTLWNSKAEWIAARPAMAAAVGDDPFDEWEDAPPEVFHLEPV